MPALDGPVSGGVVGGRESDLNVKRLHDLLVQIRDEAIAVVRDGRPGRPIA